MNDTRQTKVNQMGLQGAVSQVKLIYASVRDSGINVPEVNDNGLSEGDCLFTYINALHTAIGRKGIPVKTVEKTVTPSSPPVSKQQPSGSQPANLSGLKDEIRNMAVQALLDAEKQVRIQKESERLASGKLSAEQWIENNAVRMVSLAEWCRDYSEQYNRIINQYNDSMMQAFKMSKAIAENNGKIADKVSSLDSTLKPLVPVVQDALNNSEMTHWRLIRQSFQRRKSNPCWKNPYTYMCVFIGLLFSTVFCLSLYRNSELRKMNAELMHENQVHRIVDVFMEPYATYRKERTMIQKCIESNGLKYTWDTVLEMRAKVDSLEAAK